MSRFVRVSGVAALLARFDVLNRRKPDMATAPRKSQKRSQALKGNKNARGNSGGGSPGGTGNTGETEMLIPNKQQTKQLVQFIGNVAQGVPLLETWIQPHAKLHGFQVPNFFQSMNTGPATRGTSTKRTAAKRGTRTQARPTGGRQQQDRTGTTG
jgi:hypothetical protein